MPAEASPVILPEVDRAFLKVLRSRRDEGMPESELHELMHKIRPVISDDHGQRFYIDPAHPRDTNIASAQGSIVMGRADGPGGIVYHSTIYTLHFVGRPGEFQASFAEVIQMIPARLLFRVVAFEIVGPHADEDFDRQSVAIRAGYHVAATHLYV
jgi:hypothetical protein